MVKYLNFRIYEMSNDFTCSYEVRIDNVKHVHENTKNQQLYEFIKKNYDINLVQASRNLLKDTNIIEQDLIFGLENQTQLDI